MKTKKTYIRRIARNYLKWLTDQQWFNVRIKNKQPWLEPIEKIINKGADCPASIWEAVNDHWLATPWEHDNFPAAFETLYDLVDDYRTEKGVTSTL